MENDILYIGDTEGVSGYAQSTRRMIFALQDAGASIATKHRSHDTNISRDSSALSRIRSLQGETGGICIHQQIPHMFQPVQRKYNIGYTMFETSCLPNEWLTHLEQMDEIWVPSNFNKLIFQRSGVNKPVTIVPFPIDLSLYVPARKENKVFRFLSIFQWTERKNWKELLYAYMTEFSYHENVELYLKVYGSSDSEYDKRMITEQVNQIVREIDNKNRPTYHLDLSIKSERDIVGLHQSSDVFVLPTRGEAIGLTYLEAMACGVPCIATAWGGQTDFINDKTGYLVDYSMERVGNMPHIREYRSDQEWAKADRSSLKAQMRQAFSNRDRLLEKGTESRRFVETHYSPQNITAQILNRLRPYLKSTPFLSTIPSISYKGDAFGLSGYSNAIRLNLRVFNQAKIDVRLKPVYHDRRQIEETRERKILTDLVNKSGDGDILIDHQTPEFYNTGTSKYKIGITYFETSKIPDLWVDKCNHMDEIWLPCKQNEEAFRSSGVTSRIELLNPFLDTEHYSPNKKPWNIANKASFNFVSVFEFIPRKGWDILIEAYARAFRKNEDVCLIIKTYRMHPPMSEQTIKQAMKDHLFSKGITEWPKMLVYTQPVPYEILPNLYNAGNVFVLATRGEALCYPALEAMSCGKPCIITNSGGQTAFVTNENGYPIDWKMVPVTNFNHSPWYKEDQMMTEPDITHLMRTMRSAYENRSELKEKGLRARLDIERNHSLSSGYDWLTKRLHEISANL